MFNNIVDNSQSTGAPTSAPTTTDTTMGTPQGTAPLVNPLLAEPAPQGQAPQQVGADNQQTAQAQELLLGKFKTADELAKAYQNLESFSTQKAQEAAQFKTLLDNYQGMLDTMKAQQVQQPQIQQPTPEEIQARNEELLSKFYEDPQGTLERLVEEKAKQLISPIQEKINEEQRVKEWNQKATEFANAHTDLADYAEDIGQVFKQNPDLMNHPKGLEIAYNYSKGQRYQPVNPQQLLQDESFRAQILKDESIKNAFLSQHMASIQQNSPPPLMGNQTGGINVALPENNPKTLQESTNLFLSRLGLRK